MFKYRMAGQAELLALFPLGGTAYLALEIAWRGTTHWTMFFAGGVCLCALQWLEYRPMPVPVLAAVGAAGVSGVELAFGLVCTGVLHCRVWDYSREWGNLAGLVCPKYSALWYLLCLWLLATMRFVRRGLAARRPSLPEQSGSWDCRESPAA
ncbi:MAG: hypothetical protein U0L91_03115 [Gemmiger sp.]|uniref:putative ABC transporter permease n=1 Tax=Gemmiger sp. TaxID=2049027 RepID=UPI002E782797|nr:hypothetical protein [Gemmiger sp.]MEE0800253.1 hypothetical protein [Gemmiger sp.]